MPIRRDNDWDILVERHKRLMAANPDAFFSKVDARMFEAVVNRNPQMLSTGENFFSLHSKNYTNVLKLLIEFEKIHTDIMMRKFDQTKVMVVFDSYTDGNQWYRFELAGLSKGHPNLIPGDMIILDDWVNQPERFTIQDISGDIIKFSWDRGGARQIEGTSFYMSFHSKAIPYKLCAENLLRIEGCQQIQRMLFWGKKYMSVIDASEEREADAESVAKINERATRNDYVDARLSRCNEQQKRAITNIMEAKCRPNLYILFGPPGTGKTFTLIEAAGQIVQRDRHARILICAKSNNCVNDLAQKMLETSCVKKTEFIRLCSLCYYGRLYDKRAPIPEYFTDMPDAAMSKRVVVTTNLVTAKLKNKFDYVLMDEAGHASIPESLLPCSRVVADGCFVLAGDPKQLGPVVVSREIGQVGLNESLLKRMFGEYLYGQHNGKYNERYITKLLDSYRCDPRIMELNNQLYYKGELRYLAKPTPPSILAMLKFPKPVVFSSVLGQTSRMELNYSPSLMNLQEAEACVYYVFRLYFMGFEPEQIGVICYYALQKEIIREIFEDKLHEYEHKLNSRFKRKNTPLSKSSGSKLTSWLLAPKKMVGFKENDKNKFDWHCKIDTVDAFQGNERDIIIISTTVTYSTEFIMNTNRFNVATSRARWLNIVVGHPNVLTSSGFWRRFAKEAYRTTPPAEMAPCRKSFTKSKSQWGKFFRQLYNSTIHSE